MYIVQMKRFKRRQELFRFKLKSKKKNMTQYKHEFRWEMVANLQYIKLNMKMNKMDLKFLLSCFTLFNKWKSNMV